MKKRLTILGMLLSLAVSYAQEGRVGINTETPQATLDIVASKTAATTSAQGVIFPRFATEERAKFINVAEGTMIYNTTKKCLEVFKGLDSGGDNGWHCAGEEIDAKTSIITKMNNVIEKYLSISGTQLVDNRGIDYSWNTKIGFRFLDVDEVIEIKTEEEVLLLKKIIDNIVMYEYNEIGENIEPVLIEDIKLFLVNGKYLEKAINKDDIKVGDVFHTIMIVNNKRVIFENDLVATIELKGKKMPIFNKNNYKLPVEGQDYIRQYGEEIMLIDMHYPFRGCENNWNRGESESVRRDKFANRINGFEHCADDMVTHISSYDLPQRLVEREINVLKEAIRMAK